ncbi:MAG: SRPBCC family protein [Vicinamibacterales bacterium]
MATVRVGTLIRAPLERVFRVFTDIEGSALRVRNIQQIEMLTPGAIKIGSRWRETRELMGQTASEELQITAFEMNRMYTITCDTHGTRFDCTFRFTEAPDGTDVMAELDIIPQSFGARLVAPFGALVLSNIEKSLEQDLMDLTHAVEAAPV